MNKETQTKIESAVFNRFIKHLDEHKEVQNIDLMILADFCRNCLSKWYSSAAVELGENVSVDQAREIVYGMPYSEWKQNHQTEASPEQMAAFNSRAELKKQTESKKKNNS